MCSVRKGVLRNFAKFTGKHLSQSLFLNKVAGLRSATLLKKRLRHKCLPVNFAKFLRTPFSQNKSGRLLLWLKELDIHRFVLKVWMWMLNKKYIKVTAGKISNMLLTVIFFIKFYQFFWVVFSTGKAIRIFYNISLIWCSWALEILYLVFFWHFFIKNKVKASVYQLKFNC